jgi:RNA polymerase-associated protein LEO1
MRLPAYVNVESKPYDPMLYRAGLEQPEKEDVNMKRARMIQVRNTIRWKWSTGDDGKPVRFPTKILEIGAYDRNVKVMLAL